MQPALLGRRPLLSPQAGGFAAVVTAARPGTCPGPRVRTALIIAAATADVSRTPPPAGPPIR
jgi:hypothetical protein